MKSAEILQRDVLDELAWDSKVDSSTVQVTATEDGVVTLKGTVRTYSEKIDAEKAVKRVSGVKGIANDLTIELLKKYKRDDTAIAQAVLSAFKWTYAVPANKLKVTVEDGWVKLEGEVDWQYQKRVAESAAKFLMGVRGVTNLITLKSKVLPSEVKQKIESAFKRSAEIDAEHITVDVTDHKVTLRGTVQSWAEKEAAGDGAWHAEGVTEVVNLLSVEEFASTY